MSVLFHPNLSGASSRWFGPCVLLLSLLVHWLTLEWAQGNLTLPTISNMGGKPDAVVQIALQTTALPEQEIRPPPARRQARSPVKPADTTNKARETEPAPAAAAAAPPAPDAESTNLPQPGDDLPSPAIAQGSLQKATPEAPPIITEPDLHQDSPPLFERAMPPPSADLFYTVRAKRSDGTIEGSGKIFWRASQEHYSIKGEAGILFFTLLSYQSTGTVSTQGIAPELYTEKRFRKSATNTHFHRDRQTISFSASTATTPRKGDEQDRASIIWQLASLGRGDASRLAPGLVFELRIAGTRSTSNWRIYVNGKETVNIGGKNTEAWHLSLLPAERSYEQQLEVWLAPQMDWYPVKLLYTDLKDGHLEMLLVKIQTSVVGDNPQADHKTNFQRD